MVDCRGGREEDGLVRFLEKHSGRKWDSAWRELVQMGATFVPEERRQCDNGLSAVSSQSQTHDADIVGLFAHFGRTALRWYNGERATVDTARTTFLTADRTATVKITKG
jgi:hypothetical protein